MTSDQQDAIDPQFAADNPRWRETGQQPTPSVEDAATLARRILDDGGDISATVWIEQRDTAIRAPLEARIAGLHELRDGLRADRDDWKRRAEAEATALRDALVELAETIRAYETFWDGTGNVLSRNQLRASMFTAARAALAGKQGE